MSCTMQNPPPSPNCCSDCANDAIPAEDLAVVYRVRLLQQTMSVGKVRLALRGMHIGLLCERDDTPSAMLFRRAATELGAHVAHIRPTLSPESSAADIRATARVLGHLYDLVECQGISPTLVAALGHGAGIPVYDDLASLRSATPSVAVLLGPDLATVDGRRLFLQALLLGTKG